MTWLRSSTTKGQTQRPAAVALLLTVSCCWILLLLLLLSFGGHPLLAHGFLGPLPTPTRSFASLRTLRRQVSCSENDILSRCDYDDNDDGMVAPILIRHQSQPPYHTVQGLECVAVTIGWPRIALSQQQQQPQLHNEESNTPTVTIVEATARSQAVLVDQALEHDSLAPRDSDVYGAVVWPAALVLAERLVLWLLLKQSQSQPSTKPLKILEVGAGTGLVSLAAWRLGGGAHDTVVLATDYHDLPLQLLQYAAQYLNFADDNNENNNNNNHASTSQLHTAHLDLCDYRNTPLPRPPSDNNDNDNDFTIMVAADVLYEPATGVALAHRAVEALARGMHVWIADSPGRAGRTALLQTLHDLLFLSDDDDTPPSSIAFTNVTGWTVTGERHELICGPHSSSVTRNSNNNEDATATPQPLDVALLQLDPAHYRNVAVVSQLSTHTLPNKPTTQ